MVDGISGWVGWITAAVGCASSWLDSKGLDVGAVHVNGCGGGGLDAAGWIRDSGW